MERLRKKISYNIRDLVQSNHQMEDTTIALFAAGITARSAKTAVAMARSKASRWASRAAHCLAFPDDAVRKMLQNVETVIVPGSIRASVNEIKRLTKNKSDSNVIGLQRVNGKLITPNDILRKIKEVM